jgi:hypothetical protein
VIILVANHPEIVAAELKISLPKTIAMFPLETLRSPGLSRLRYRVIQASFAYDPVGLVMVNIEAFMVKMACYLVWTPIVPFSQLNNFLP